MSDYVVIYQRPASLRMPSFYNGTQRTVATPITATFSNGARDTSHTYGFDRELDKMRREMKESAAIQDNWNTQRQLRLAAEDRAARVASRDSTRRTVQTRSRARGEPERRAALSVRQFAQRVR